MRQNWVKTTSLLILSLSVFLTITSSVIPLAVHAQEKVLENQSLVSETIRYSGSCVDKINWIANPADNTETSEAFFVKNDNRRFLSNDNPKTAPEKYYKMLCASADRMFYKDSKGALIKIDNKFKQSIESKVVTEVKQEKKNGKLVTVKTNKNVKETFYVNTGNDYIAKFPTNPNNGFYFKTKNTAEGVEFEVVKVSIGGKELKVNKPTIKDNILTYPEVLEGVDLQYQLNTNGITKFFVIKNADALKKSDLTSYTFDLADSTKVEKKDEKKDQLNAILEKKGASDKSLPTISKAKNGEEIVSTNASKEKTALVAELDKKSSTLESVKKEEEAKGDKKDEAIIELAKQSIESTNSVKDELTNNKVDITDTKTIFDKTNTLDATTSTNEKIVSVNQKDNIVISNPIIFDQNQDSIKTIPSSVSNTKDRLTIAVEKNYLNSKDRKFPIYVDPQLGWSKPYGDTFVSVKATGNNHVNHSVRLLAGNPSSDNTTGVNFGYSEAFIGFKNPTPAGTQTVEAKLIVNIYQTSNNNFNLGIKNLDRWVDEGTISWFNNKPNLIDNEVGSINTGGNIQNNSKDIQNWRSSSNLSNYVQGRAEIQVGLYASAGNYAWFCSKDSQLNKDTAPCVNGNHVGPQLSIIYSKTPNAPIVSNFNTTDDVGQCDLSKTIYQNDKCSVNKIKNLEAKNIDSGEGASESSRVKLFTSNQIGMTSSDNNLIDHQRIFQVTGNKNQSNATDSVNINTGVGVYRTTIQTEDQYNLHSSTNNGYYQIDNGSPVAYSGIKTEGVKAKDGSYIIGRSNPENTQPQIKFNAPTYADALYNKFSVVPEYDANKILDVQGGFDPLNAGVRQIQEFNGARYNTDAQVFSQDGYNVKLNNSNFCWDRNASNATLVSNNCNDKGNQKIVYDAITKQFKLLSDANSFSGLKYGNITLLNNTSKSFNINGGNDNQTKVVVADTNKNETQLFRYNLLTKEIINAKGKCLDTGSSAQGQDLRISDCHNGNNQKFNIDAKNRIVSVSNTAVCVDSEGNDKVGSRLYMYACHEGVNQKFKVEVSNNGTTDLDFNNPNECLQGGYSDSLTRFAKCDLNNKFQKFNILMEDIVRIATTSSRNDKGVVFNSAQINGTGEGSKLYSNPTGMEYQQLRYLKTTEQVRTNQNWCLDYDFNATAYFAPCHNGVNQKWITKILNGKKVIASRFIKNGSEMCLTSNKTGDINTHIFVSACNGGTNQEFSFENYSKYLFQNNEIQYQARISENQDGSGTSVVIPWQGSDVFQFNSDANLSSAFKVINNNTYTLKIEDGKSYFVSIQARDRNTNTSNISSWSTPEKLTVDTSLPQVNNLKTTVRGQNQTVSFTLLEKNLESSKVQLYNINNQLVRNIDTTCDTQTPMNCSVNLDGKNDQSQQLNDGSYRIEVLAKDFAGNVNTSVNTMDVEVNGAIAKSVNIIKLSNTAPIYVVNPVNNAWVNTPTLNIEGSIGRVNSVDPNGVQITKQAKEATITKNDLDGPANLSNGFATEKLEINQYSNFTKKTNLDLGQNEFKIVSTDTDNKTNDKIGDPAKPDTLANKLVINREDVAPNILSTKFNGMASSSSNIPTINDSSATVEVVLQDAVVKDDFKSYVSGLNIGKNPKGFNISMLRSIDGLNSFREIPLFRNGVNISDPNPNPRLVGDIDCMPYWGDVANANNLSPAQVTYLMADVDYQNNRYAQVKCTFKVENLKLDAYYKLHANIADKAGNTVCTRHYDYIEVALNNETKCPKLLEDKTLNVAGYQSSPIKNHYGYDIFRIKTSTYLKSSNVTDYNVSKGGLNSAELIARTKDVKDARDTEVGITLNKHTFDIENDSYLIIRNQAFNRMLIIDPKYPNSPIETDLIDNVTTLNGLKNYYSLRKGNVKSSDYSVFGPATSVCGNMIDHDGVAETPVINTCKIEVSVYLDALAGSRISNPLTFYGQNGIISDIYKTNQITDFSKYVLTSKALIGSFSPDGDGKFDTIDFVNQLGFKHNGVAFDANVDDFRMVIRDNSGVILSDTPVTGKLEDGNTLLRTSFNGRVNNVVLKDGTYQQYLTMKSKDGTATRIASNIVQFAVINNITPSQAPAIFTPIADYTTTRGVVTLQGMGPKSDLINSASQFQINICARLSNKTLLTPEIQSQIPKNGCVYESKVNTSNTGFYAMLVTLPFENQEYEFNVTSSNTTQGQKSTVSSVKVLYSTPESIKTLDLVSSLEGLNTQDEMNCVFNPSVVKNINCSTITINNLKVLQITTQVTKGTEGLELDFNDLTNLNALPNDDKSSYYGQYSTNSGKRIAIINDETEANVKFNPKNDNRIKATQVGKKINEVNANVLTGKDLSYASLRKPCLLDVCTWTYNYVLPYQMAGGRYEVIATTYKGESVQKASSTFEVNGIVKLAPKVIRTQKNELTAKCKYLNAFEGGNCNETEVLVNKAYVIDNNYNIGNQIVNNVNSKKGLNWVEKYNPQQAKAIVYNTNNKNFTAIIGGDNNEKFRYDLFYIDDSGKQIYIKDGYNVTSTINSTGIATLNFNLDKINHIAGNQDAEFNHTNTGRAYTLLVTPVNQTTGEAIFAKSESSIIIYDKTTPSVTNVITTNTTTTASQNSINPWIRNGDNIKFEIKSNVIASNNTQNFDYGYVISESGYREPLKVETINGNTSLVANLTIQREKLEGLYYPTIFIADKSGNSILVNNEPRVNNNQVLLNNIKLDNKTNLKKANIINNQSQVFYDFDQVAYSPIQTFDLPYNPLDNNASIYNQTPRTQSTDFSLILDNTRPLQGDFNMLNVGQSTIEYNSITNQPNVISSSQSLNSTRNGATRLDGARNTLGNGGLNVDRNAGQTIIDPANNTLTRDSTNQGYSLVTRNNKVELRLTAEKYTRVSLFLKEGKNALGSDAQSLGKENEYTQTQVVIPSSTTIDQSSCTTDQSRLTFLSRLRESDGKLIRLAGSKNGQYNPTSTTSSNSILGAYDNNLIPVENTDSRSTQDKLGNLGIVTQSATYCDIIFTYDFKDRRDTNGNPIVNQNKKVGIGESPNGNPLEYFNLSFTSTDLAGNTNLKEQDYVDLLNEKNTNPANKNNIQPLQVCAYNPTTGQLDPRLNTIQKAYNQTDIFFTNPNKATSNQSCQINVSYDTEAPSNNAKTTSTSGLTTRTGINTITSKSYGNNTEYKPIPFLESNQNNESNQLSPITRDNNINVTTTAEARADIVYTLQNGYNDIDPITKQNSTYVNIQNNEVRDIDPNKSINDSVSNTSKQWREYGTELLIPNSDQTINQNQKRNVIIKKVTNPTTKQEEYKYFYFNNTEAQSTEEVPQALISNTTRIIENGEKENPTTTTNFNLTRNITSRDNKSKRDDDTTKGNCTTTNSNPIATQLGTIPATVNRKVGTCDDGLYKINTYAVDSAGNVLKNGNGNPMLTSRLIERDSVAPNKPEINHNLSGSILGQNLNLNIKGEANTIGQIKVNSTGTQSNLDEVYGYKLDNNGNYTTTDLLGKLKCETDYTLSVNLIDRAGNQSETTSVSFRTMNCPVCPTYNVVDKSTGSVNTGATSGTFASPIRGYSTGHNSSQRYGAPREYDGRSWGHEGLDFNGANNPPTYSIAPGIVTFAGDNGLYGNFVRVDHRNGYVSEYAHLSKITVSLNQQVDNNVQLGIVGNTGNSFGAHLHLNIALNGKRIDPLTVLNTQYSYTPTTTAQNTKYAVVQTGAGNLTADEARQYGCDVPELPSDYDPSQDESGNGTFEGEEENFVELPEIKSENLDIEELVTQIKNSLGDDFNHYFKNNCTIWDFKCNEKYSSELVDKLKEFLENLINGIKDGLIKAAQNLIEEFQKLFDTLVDLIKDPWKTVKEVFNEAKKIWDGIWELINNITSLTKVIFQNISEFFTEDRKSRIKALGKAIGLFIGDKVANAIKGALTGGPVAAIASTIKSIVDKAKEALSFVVKTAQLVGEKIKVFAQEILIRKFGNKVGSNLDDILKIDTNDIKQLTLTEPKRTLLLEIKTFVMPKLPSSITTVRAKHILKGDNRGGGHHYNSLQGNGFKATNRSTPISNGAYKMDYQYTDAGGNLIKKANHTMFPDSWDAQKTIDKIQEVYNSPSTIQIPNTNKWTGTTSEGIKITIMKYSDGKIISSYPNLL